MVICHPSWVAFDFLFEFNGFLKQIPIRNGQAWRFDLFWSTYDVTVMISGRCVAKLCIPRAFCQPFCSHLNLQFIMASVHSQQRRVPEEEGQGVSTMYKDPYASA